MIQFKPTRNIDLIEAVGNHPDIIAGSNNGGWHKRNESNATGSEKPVGAEIC